MLKKLNNRFFAFGLLAVAVAQVVHAEVDGWEVSNLNARNSALKQNYFSMQDDYDFWTNPALLGGYTNRAYGAISSTTATKGDDAVAKLAGGNLNVKWFNVGVYQGRAYAGSIANTLFSPTLLKGAAATTASTYLTPAPATNPAVKNLIDVLFSTELGAIQVGARLNINRYSISVTNPTGALGGGSTVNLDNKSVAASDTNLVVGVAMKNMPLDFAMSFGSPSFSSTAEYNQSNSTTVNDRRAKSALEDASIFAIAARMDVANFSGGLFRVSAKYARQDSKIVQSGRDLSTTASIVTTNADQAAEATMAATSYSGYGAFVLKPANGLTIIASSGLEYAKLIADGKLSDNAIVAAPLQEKSTTTAYSAKIPARLGLEVEANKNWTLRGGAARNLYSKAKDTVNNTITAGIANALSDKVTESTDADAVVELALGLRYTLGDAFMLDATVNKDVLFTGTYLVSGVPDTLATQVSFIYKF
ncbi:MAG: hypothetical protein OEW08_04960 [Gammaproteobacteria bacterium]|nr:hypothetical protein [Gammaproteobacteria bacterium]